MQSLITEAFTIIIIVKESGRYTYMQACMSTSKIVYILKSSGLMFLMCNNWFVVIVLWTLEALIPELHLIGVENNWHCRS